MLSAAARVPQPENDIAALVKSVEGTIWTIASRFGRNLSQTDLDDLHSAGKIGAVIAARRYEPARGASFNTHATWWIRAYVMNEAFSFWRDGRCGDTKTARKAFFHYGKARRAVLASGREPTPEAIADALGISADDFIEVEAATAAPAPDAFLEDVADESKNALETLCGSATAAEVHATLDKLDLRSRYIIEQHFYADRQIAEIAASLGLTPSRVNQIKSAAISTLRRVLP